MKIFKSIKSAVGRLGCATRACVAASILSAPLLDAQSVINNNGVATRFQPLTNALWTCSSSSPFLALTNTQGATFPSLGAYAEAAINKGRGLTITLIAASTNYTQTNRVSFGFDASTFGSTNKTAPNGVQAITGANTNLLLSSLIGDGYYYTLANTNSSALIGSSQFNYDLLINGSNRVVTNIFIANSSLDNLRFFRWTYVTNAIVASSTSGGASGTAATQVTDVQVVVSEFPGN